eukprot:TRINITY_DN2922_c5_g1_i1.p1 TRINITY_DN2922_c5_g1~~TRINITY_DN2922_c5_g1_i1.p1  ORF type:complete len:515 (-),score=56.88 TRINITY_DN2922_c5_g1_i1:135-1679(-)
MEGRASNFRKVLADFESKLQGAEFVAIDTELTGVDLEGDPDSFDESAQQRVDKQCCIAERYTLIQLGLTIVGRVENGTGHEHLTFSSYNIYSFPYVGPETSGRDQGFYCQAPALQFNAQHNIDFNTWIKEGVPYMNREEESYILQTTGTKEGSTSHEEKIGLLRLWKALCAARLPFVVHCPLDLFFLLAVFEQRPLPRNNAKALAAMVRKCTPKVYDTAHLHGALGRFKRLGLMKFFEDAKARYEEVTGNGNGAIHLKCTLAGETAVRYGDQNDDLAHEAGFDSLVTAQLFAYLRVISPQHVKEAGNRLFLYRSTEYLDLDRAYSNDQVGVSMFDLSRVTLLVAALDPGDVNDAPRLIAAAGYVCKWIDSNHVLVVLRASGGAAVRKAAELAGKVHGVVSWMGYDEWRDAQASRAKSSRDSLRLFSNRRSAAEARRTVEDDTNINGNSHAVEDTYGVNGHNGGPWWTSSGNSPIRRIPPLGILGISCGILLLLLTKCRGQLISTLTLIRRWQKD